MLQALAYVPLLLLFTEQLVQRPNARNALKLGHCAGLANSGRARTDDGLCRLSDGASWSVAFSSTRRTFGACSDATLRLGDALFCASSGFVMPAVAAGG
jgi:hypothetical protein